MANRGNHDRLPVFMPGTAGQIGKVVAGLGISALAPGIAGFEFMEGKLEFGDLGWVLGGSVIGLIVGGFMVANAFDTHNENNGGVNRSPHFRNQIY